VTLRGQWAVAVVGLMIAAIAAYNVLFWSDNKLRREAMAVFGLPEAQAIAKLGPPHKLVSAGEVASDPSAKWWGADGGWFPAPTRPVTNKVLLYYALFLCAAVYVGPNGNVEYVHIMGT